MIKYHVRSRDLITVVNEVKAQRLISDAYFQRNLVWREIHKQDFIKTILLGYPCPQIFISRGVIDVDRMETTSVVVDGQQRMDAIVKFIAGEFRVEGRRYQDLTGDEKSEFLKYELAVIELDLDNNDQRIKDIFQRLNRTSNSLTAIEKLASQYAPSQFMLVATHLAGELEYPVEGDEERFRIDPAVDVAFFEWARDHPAPNMSRVYQEWQVFRTHEVSRKVHLMHILNLMATVLGGFFNRNEKTRQFLDEYAEIFEQKDSLIELLEYSAQTFVSMNLQIGSYWANKANVFSILVAVAGERRQGREIDPALLGGELERFAHELPQAYRDAATEGVNDARERRTRHGFLADLVSRAVRV